MSTLQPEPCPPGGNVRDVENLLLCDIVDGEVVGTALAVYEYDANGNPVGAPIFVDPATGAPYVVQGSLQTCSNNVSLSETTIDALTIGQVLSTQNTQVITATEAQPGNPWIGGSTDRTRSKGYVEVLLTAIAVGGEVSGTYTFQFGENGVDWPITITVPVRRFSTIKFRPLKNAGEFFRAQFEPDDPLGAKAVVLTTQFSRVAGPDFVVTGSHRFEIEEAAFGQIWSFPRVFTPGGDDVVVLGTPEGSMYVRQEGVEITPSGAQFSQGLTPYIRHDFGVDTVVADLERMIDLSVGGSAIPDTVAGGGLFVTDAAPGSVATFLSEHHLPYNENPGHGIHGDITLFLDPTSDPVGADAYVEWGYCPISGPDSAFGYGYHGTFGLYTFLRKLGSETFREYQPGWNIDPMLGGPLSRYRRLIDGLSVPEALIFLTDNLYRIQTELLYAAEQRFKVKVPISGNHHDTHVHQYPGTATATSLPTGQLHLFIQVSNGTDGGQIAVRSGSIVGGMFSSNSVTIGRDPDGALRELRVQGAHSGNSTVEPLDANETWRGEWFAWQDSYIKLILDMKADVAGTAYIDLSEQVTPVNGDESSVDDSVIITYDPAAEPLLKRHIPVQSRWVRARYVNGVAAQASMRLDSAFVTADPGVPMQSLRSVPRKLGQAGTVRAVMAIENAAGDGYQEIPVDGSGIPQVHVTEVDADLFLSGLPTTQVRQFTVGPTPVQLDVTKLPGRRSATVHNKDTADEVHVGHHSGISPDLDTFPIWPKTSAGGQHDEFVDLWACTSGGGVETVTNLAGSSATGTATSPSNALTSNDTDATLDAIGEFVNVTGFAAGTTNALVSVKLGIEAAKQAGQFETVAWQETKTGRTTGSGTVTTDAALAGGTAQFYYATITRNANTGTVTGVSGLGLTWVPVLQNVTSGNRRMDTWYAVGDATAGTVTATLSTSTNAHIAVGRYTDVDQTSPIQAFSSTASTGTAVTGPALAGTNKGYSVLSVSHTAASGTAGAGYTERADESNGSGSNTDSIYVENKALTATGTETATATLASSVAWATIGVTLTPRAANDPVVEMSYEYFDVTGATTSEVTLSSTSDVTSLVDVTTDRAWVYSDIAAMEVIATAQSVGAAAALIDRLFVQITDTSATTVRVSLREIA